MRAPAAAFAWEFRRHHRWGLAALFGFLVVAAIIRVVFVPEQRINFQSAETFSLFVIIPLTAMFLYFLAIFSFGLSGDLAARHSIYPPRLFTLPVTSSALALWPMLYGSAAVAGLWFVTRLLGVWPSDSDVPIVWPAVLAASLLAWTQALTWLPYPMPGLRVIVTVLWLATIDTIVMIALDQRAPETWMLAILAPNLPAAYFVARYAVARARRGDIPHWTFELFGARRSDGEFRSPAQAQAWFEWRQYGRSLPMLMAILLPFELSFFFLFHNYPAIVTETLAAVLLTPTFMAIFVAATASSGLTSFLTTRPSSDAALISAKLKAAARSAIATWLLVIVAIVIAATFSGTLGTLSDLWDRLVEILGTPRATALVFLLLAVLVASTWKQLVQSLYIGMTGRGWLVKGSVFAALVIVTIALPVFHWLFTDPQAMGVVWKSMGWIAAALVCLKLTVATWIGFRLYDRRALSTRDLIFGAILVDAAVFALFGALAWILPEIVLPRYFLALVAILAVPLARVSAAPLALAWNRHR